MGKTVIMVMDMQDGIIQMIGEPAHKIIDTTATTLAAARAANVPVIYITISFRPGQPELSARNVMMERVKAMGAFTDGSAPVQIAAAIKPQDGDILVTKRRASAFSGSDLDVVLRGLDAERLVMAGFATSGVVLSTVREAADLDFRITVLRDLCWDMDEETHRVLLDKVFPRQGEVVTSQEWVEGLKSQ